MYKINRIGFVNFWLYDEEDFYFYDGKLLLRGSNGSGKTVTMQSFFPLIFDGNKSPERLDPFGSRDRKIEDYLLLNENVNENTGYIYMEFYDKEKNNYLTIGIGLKAVRNRPTDFWGFSVTDNRRIGKDLLLFKERSLRIPLTKKELQNRISSGGEFVDTIKEYKKMVNKYLFGFPNIDLYSEFINLIIQIRSPKLSNSTKPKELTKILSSVLEPLSEEDLRVMADSMEDMNKYKEKLSDLKIEKKSCDSFKNSFKDYNQALLYQKGKNYLEALNTLKEKENTIKINCQGKEELENNINKNTIKKQELEIEKQDLEYKKNSLEETDLKSITKELNDINDNLKTLEIELEKKNNEEENKNSIRLKKEKELSEKETELYNLEKEFDSLLKDLNDYEEYINYDDSKFYLDELKEKRFEFTNFESYIRSIERQLNLIDKIKQIAEEIKNIEDKIKIDEESYSIVEDEINKYVKDKNSVTKELIDSIDELKESISKTIDNNTILKLNNNELNDIYEIANVLDRNMISKIKDIIKNKIYILKDKLNLEISDYNIKINDLKNKKDKLKEEVKEINTILLRNVDDFDIKEYLENNNIDYKYFYELIDFKDIDEKTKTKIESFLYETGIITSIVIDKNIPSNIKIKYLKETTKKDNNLTKYLYALDTVFKDRVNSILESISLDENNNEYIKDSSYKLSIISGITNNSHNLRYIGEEVRNNYIDKEKDKINIDIKKIDNEILNLNIKIEELNNNIKLIDIEEENFRFSDKIKKYFDKLDEIDINIKVLKDNMDKVMENIKTKNIELKKLNDNINEERKEYYGPIDYNSLKELEKDTNTYFDILKRIQIPFNNHFKTQELVYICKEILDSTNIDLDNIRYELNNINIKIINYNNKKKNLDSIINSDKYRDTILEYEKIKERLSLIEEERDKILEYISSSKEKISNIDEKIINSKNELEILNIKVKVLEKIFNDEYNLNYIEDEITDINKFLRDIKTNLTINDSLNRFYDNANKYLSQLVNYSVKFIDKCVPKDNEYLDFTSDINLKEEITNLLNDAKRKDLSFNQGGRVMNLIELSNYIDLEINSYEALLSDENTKLFKDTLINNIGSSIRNKIHSSEEWISEVRNLMESMNTSSGLSFSINWVGNSALTENEIDTKKIVEIFKKDASILKNEDIEKITNHFQSKIKSKEEALEESERNYLEIIKEVLDYRSWFEFKLYYKRGNSEKKELTDREFNKMSGGEKAIAMYIPLFSSVYAKLNSAYSYAPRVIALDEAFAGVDDENIKDAFRILNKLNLDYVLTSQQLWGDYETVKHLAISELHHPVGSNVVSIIKYKWDGERRKKVENDREYESL